MNRLWTRCAPPTVPFVVTGADLSLPVDNNRDFDVGALMLYFAFSSAMLKIAPVCFTAEPELSVDALDSVLGARAAGLWGVGASEADGLLPVTVGFCTGGGAFRVVRCRDPTDSSDSPSLDA